MMRFSEIEAFRAVMLSGSTTVAAQTLHTSSTKKGEVYLLIGNNSTLAVESFVELGDTVSPIRTLISPSQGLVPILPGVMLRNGKVLKAYCSTVSTAALHAVGWVNELSS